MKTYTSLFIKQNVRIPTILAVAIVAAVAGFLYKFAFVDTQPTQATKKNISYMEITNLAPTQTTIVWQTSEKETGWVLYGKGQNDVSLVALDDRDLQNNRKQFRNHYATLKNLQANTRYYFRLTDGQKLLQSGDNSLFSFKTPISDNRVNNLKPAYGKIISQSSRPLENVVVVLSHKGSYSLATVSKASGEWLIPMNSTINKGTLRLQTPSETDEISLVFMDEEGRQARVKAKMNLVSPLRESIIMGKSYVFDVQEQILSASTKSASAIKIVFDVLYPKNNAVIPVGNPLIKGTAESGTEISVTIQSTQLRSSYSAISSKEGSWKVNLPSALSPGAYTLSASIQNQPSIRPIQRLFTIAKSGERILGEATGSAQLTPSATSTPTLALSPTRIPPLSPTRVPTLPSTGGTITTFALASFALILLGAGLLVVF